MVYGVDVIFPAQLAYPVARFLQEADSEPNDLTRRIDDLVETQQNRERLVDKMVLHQNKIKHIFDKKVKEYSFKTGDLVLKWDAGRKDKGKHGKFDVLWTRPFMISSAKKNNMFDLQNLAGEEVPCGPFNGRFLKVYFS